MQFLDQCFFGGAFTSGIVGSGMDTTGFAVVFLPSSRCQAIFLDSGAATFFTTKCMHHAHLVQRTIAVCIIPLPKNEVKGLKSLVAKLVRLNTRLVERIKDTDTLDYSEVTPEELMIEASRVFNVTSNDDRDDNLISPDAVIKPPDWSGYV
jgi:hypothetical protein